MKSKHSQLQSFGWAWFGIIAMVKTQGHFRFHLIAGALVIAAGFYFNISKTEWMIIILTITSVLAAEALNTALEFALDAVHPDDHPGIKLAKDAAAGAVLICSISSVIIGILVFLPRMMG